MASQTVSKQLKFASIFTLILGSMFARAEVRFEDSRTWRRATLINAGQQVFSLQSSFQEVSERFTASGEVEPLGSRYSRTLTWNQLVQADTVGRADLQNYMRQNGLSGNDIAATSSYEVSRQELGFGVNWAYGLTENWMIGLQVPLTLRTTRVRQHVELTPDLARGAGQAGQKSILGLKANDVRARVKELAEAQLANSGYDNIPEQKQSWDFGDISLLSQEGLYDSYNWTWALQEQVRFPTAQTAAMSDYIQSSMDEGTVNLGITSMLDYQQRRWTYGFRLGYVAQLPDSARMRGREDANTTTSQVDPKVRRDLGDWLWTALDTEYRLSRKWDFNAEYAFLTKGKDKYSGNTFSAAEYASLSENTDQQLHQTRLGVLYRLGAESSRSGVMNKWVASLDYTYPWIGHNAMEASRTSLELINYF